MRCLYTMNANFLSLLKHILVLNCLNRRRREQQHHVCKARRASTYWSGLRISRTGVIRRASQLFLVKLCQLVDAWLISPPESERWWWKERERLLCFFFTLHIIIILGPVCVVCVVDNPVSFLCVLQRRVINLEIYIHRHSMFYSSLCVSLIHSLDPANSHLFCS